ncbi:MAG TPA: MFS transporter [Stellaceae bacterium]|jgi:putative MFS transporter|nr:MFS transporter [Stellaceae bacterium]
MTVTQSTAESGVTDLAASRLADEIAARMDRLPMTARHRRTAGTIAFGTFFDSFDSLIIAAALTAIISSLHISYTQVGLLISSAYLGMTVGAPFFGWLAEVFGRKPVCVWMIASFGALSLAAAFAWDFESLFVVRMIEGLALGGQIPVSSALYSEFLPAARRGRLFFWGYTVLFSTGIFLAPVVGLACFAIFGPEVGWRVLFFTGGLALPLALLMHYLVPESPRWLAENGRGAEADEIVARYETAAKAEGKPLPAPQVHYRGARETTRLAELFQGIYPRRTALSWLLFFATYFVSYGLQIWIPTLYVKIGGLPPNNALMLAIISGAITLCFVFVWGEVADRIGRTKSFVVGYSLAIGGFLLGIVLVSVLHVTGWPMLFSSALIALIGTNFTAALCFLYTAELFPTRMRAWATSTGSTVSRVASFIAPTAVGALLDADLGIVSVYAMFVVAACLGLAAIIFLGPETSKGALEDVSA